MNNGTVWMRLIDQVFGPELESHVFVYLGDIVIVTSTFERQIQMLREVLRRRGAAGLTLNRVKYLFCREELKYLGYVINRQGLHVDPDKVKAILETPTPTSISGVRCMVDMTSWYPRFVPERQTFCWDRVCDEAWRHEIGFRAYIVVSEFRLQIYDTD